MTRLRQEMHEDIDTLNTEQLKALRVALNGIQEYTYDPEEGVAKSTKTSKRIASSPPLKEKNLKIVTGERVNLNKLTRSELREYFERLNVSMKVSGGDPLKFLRRTRRMASTYTEEQLRKLALQKRVHFSFGKGRQTPELKHERMAAQLLASQTVTH